VLGDTVADIETLLTLSPAMLFPLTGISPEASVLAGHIKVKVSKSYGKGFAYNNISKYYTTNAGRGF
jgi:hypothetical protein